MGSAGLSETAADGAGGSALGKRGSVASGAGRQPNRRRVFRIIFSSRPIRPAIPRLLRPWALRRKMIRSRGAMWDIVSGELLREPIVPAIAPYPAGVNDEIPRNAL